MRIVGLFGLVALAELVVFIAVERRIGLGSALLIALATAVIGSILVRRAGIAVINRIRQKLTAGSLPGRELTHGAAVLVAGALLISPGFFTDVIGFLLLVPTVRDLAHQIVTTRFKGRVVSSGGPIVGEVIDVENWEES